MTEPQWYTWMYLGKEPTGKMHFIEHVFPYGNYGRTACYIVSNEFNTPIELDETSKNELCSNCVNRMIE